MSFIDAIDVNGASRQIGISLLIMVMALTLAARLRWKSPRRLTECIGMIYVGVAALVMTGLAYTVRNPCRPSYLIGCGVNLAMFAGLALAVVIVAFGLIMAYGNLPAGWVVAAYGVYYGEYMSHFTHLLDTWQRLCIVLIAVILVAIGAWSIWARSHIRLVGG